MGSAYSCMVTNSEAEPARRQTETETVSPQSDSLNDKTIQETVALPASPTIKEVGGASPLNLNSKDDFFIMQSPSFRRGTAPVCIASEEQPGSPLKGATQEYEEPVRETQDADCCWNQEFPDMIGIDGNTITTLSSPSDDPLQDDTPSPILKVANVDTEEDPVLSSVANAKQASSSSPPRSPPRSTAATPDGLLSAGIRSPRTRNFLEIRSPQAPKQTRRSAGRRRIDPRGSESGTAAATQIAPTVSIAEEQDGAEQQIEEDVAMPGNEDAAHTVSVVESDAVADISTSVAAPPIIVSEQTETVDLAAGVVIEQDTEPELLFAVIPIEERNEDNEDDDVEPQYRSITSPNSQLSQLLSPTSLNRIPPSEVSSLSERSTRASEAFPASPTETESSTTESTTDPHTIVEADALDSLSESFTVTRSAALATDLEGDRNPTVDYDSPCPSALPVLSASTPLPALHLLTETGDTDTDNTAGAEIGDSAISSNGCHHRTSTGTSLPSGSQTPNAHDCAQLLLNDHTDTDTTICTPRRYPRGSSAPTSPRGLPLCPPNSPEEDMMFVKASGLLTYDMSMSMDGHTSPESGGGGIGGRVFTSPPPPLERDPHTSNSTINSRSPSTNSSTSTDDLSDGCGSKSSSSSSSSTAAEDAERAPGSLQAAEEGEPSQEDSSSAQKSSGSKSFAKRLRKKVKKAFNFMGLTKGKQHSSYTSSEISTMPVLEHKEVVLAVIATPSTETDYAAGTVTGTGSKEQPPRKFSFA